MYRRSEWSKSIKRLRKSGLWLLEIRKQCKNGLRHSRFDKSLIFGVAIEKKAMEKFISMKQFGVEKPSVKGEFIEKTHGAELTAKIAMNLIAMLIYLKSAQR